MKNHDLNFLELVESSLLKIGECDIHEVKTMQEESKDFYLVDVREDREWVEGHIRGSIHLGKGIIERDIGRTIEDKSKLIVLYCQGGFRSALAGESIKKMGYTNVFSMSGGFSDWANNNFSIDKPQ
jgi:rhodanese-related sulfurtransferase|tara:strand:- start:74 stop:451 length:378 start_codon:yes stop_codon:yes gene_type:complete